MAEQWSQQSASTGAQKTVTVDLGDKSYLSALRAPSKIELSDGDDGADDGSDEGGGAEDGDAYREDDDYQAYEDDSPSAQAAPFVHLRGTKGTSLNVAEHGQCFFRAVSPWFFTHCGAEVLYSKNWVFPSDLLICLRWPEILALKPPFFEIIAWNDYGESHYISRLASKHTDDGA
ncbi:hypothetical protein PQX77_015349 [Marasmius sp. AFHP31]|nr:hypothetical protein PQX77_015349 [Marasmius sp. AFHP31]